MLPSNSRVINLLENNKIMLDNPTREMARSEPVLGRAFGSTGHDGKQRRRVGNYFR